MNQLEEFRAHLADDDAAARERARQLLRHAQAGPAPHQPPGRRPRPRLVAAGACAVAVSVTAVLVGVGSGDHPTGLGPAPASARAVLVDAARSAAAADDGGIPRMVRPNEYFYLEIRGTYRDGTATTTDAPPTATAEPPRTMAEPPTATTSLATRTYRSWQSLTRAGRIETSAARGAKAVPVPPATGRLQMFIGNERFSAAELADFDPTPQALYRRLLDGVVSGQGSSPESEVFVQLVDALRDVPLRPELRATFLRALAEIPGLVLTGPTKDALGRPGLGVAYIERARSDQRHTLVLSDDGALLAVGEKTAGGELLQDSVIVHQAITTDLKVPRDQPSAP